MYAWVQHCLSKLLFILVCSSIYSESIKVSIVIPVYNESSRVSALAQELQALVPTPEVLFVDGSSQDDTVQKIQQAGALVVTSLTKGRGAQLNRGIEEAQGEFLLFLHADCHLSQQAYAAMIQALDLGCYEGGAFSFQLDNSEHDWRERLIEKGVSLRNALFGLVYGDQGYFVKKESLSKIGFFKEMPLMEDVEWFGRLKEGKKYILLKEKLPTSGRRIHKRGWIKSCFTNLFIVTLYKLGVSPQKLAEIY